MKLLQLAPSIQEQVGTRSGPAGIDTLTKLASTFESPKDQERALEAVTGFESDIQTEILKRTGGDIEKIDELREQALDGAFQVHICKGLRECVYIDKGLISSVERLIELHKSGEAKIEEIKALLGLDRQTG